MEWKKINSVEQIEEIKKASAENPVLIFKHSTSCSISAMALNRLERTWTDAASEKVSPYYLDLLAYRPISSQIAQEFGIEHQSPQVLLIKNGVCIYDESHYGISLSGILQKV
ncbi:bacillithiol system redox-active protein YtxJ [Cytophagales bacterium LB-30]|uniref:Bacillithiol system redox-active protein YtxJ n=1 Tax=Shiella aurantiaca TaxID=3058365 RepID=A0ABT8F6X7_9BACT|nr:bacillithiol system redox-active protein YtxJ [Shiella aurantiaca]MDN4166246.1 bacillithiol system redox-active protein YtxJ [Shiella aurantiaca]